MFRIPNNPESNYQIVRISIRLERLPFWKN